MKRFSLEGKFAVVPTEFKLNHLVRQNKQSKCVRSMEGNIIFYTSVKHPHHRSLIERFCFTATLNVFIYIQLYGNNRNVHRLENKLISVLSL